MLFRTRKTGEQDGHHWRGYGVRIKPLSLLDYEQWARLRGESRAQLEPFEPQWAPDELTYNAFARRVRVADRDRLHDIGHAFLIFLDERPDVLVGGITLSNLQRGVSQSANLGYWLGAPYHGRGLMTAGGRLVQRYAFEKLALFRLEAAIMPSNRASGRVLEKLGFEPIGLAREYLAINGRWEDHTLFQCRRSVWIDRGLPSESPGFGRRTTA